MVASIDRHKVRSSFHKQAGDYDRYAVVQQRVVERLLGLLRAEAVSPSRLLDVGAGTGRLLAALRQEYPSCFTVGADLALGMCLTAAAKLAGDVPLVNADAERLPFQSGVFDVVVSTSTFQWLSALEAAFGEVRRVLAPDGLFCFALFGERTLFELRDSYRGALKGGEDRTHSFFSAAEVAAALEGVGFVGPRVISETEVEWHPDVPELLRSLKKIGANTTRPGTAKGLSERRVMTEMMETYRTTYGRNSQVPASYEVIYGLARVPE